MKILGYKLTSWIKHPILVWEAYGRRNISVVDLDNPENNCKFCGVDHHYKERINTGGHSAGQEIKPTKFPK